MKNDKWSQGSSGKHLKPGAPYVALFRYDSIDPFKSSFYEKKKGGLPPSEFMHFHLSGYARCHSFCDGAYDVVNNRGRGRYAYARAIHLSPQAPAYDIYLDDKLFSSKMNYLMETRYLRIRPGNHRISIYPSGQNRHPAFTKQVFTPGTSMVSFVVYGSANKTDVMVVDDKTDLYPGAVKVRLVQLSVDTPAIDLLAGRTVWFYQVMYREESAPLLLLPIRESLSVRLSENRQIVLTVPNVQFVRNRSYTIYTTGFLKGSPPLQLFIAVNGC